ncbi:hypothetical protein BJ508DRAFT_418857 [Ascobolus immersus RN42]|uniref:Uncharacterized protein n=1 Tax=Ascobolus immersus RN42 TaxID=1160509 RepID=A0A3N4HJ08_ASCIM|nr:hypothetical protein BJ508DRAFT_418857 [Ascobolus immersus RN42]
MGEDANGIGCGLREKMPTTRDADEYKGECQDAVRGGMSTTRYGRGCSTRDDVDYAV